MNTELPPIELRDDNDIRTFILFLLKNIGEPIDFDTFAGVMLNVGFVRHFTFADQFGDLLDRGLISEVKVNGKPAYIISKIGEIALEGTEDRLLNLVKQRGLTAAERFLKYLKSGFSVISYIEKIPDDEDDGVMLHCIIKDDKKTIMDLNTYVGSGQIAQKMKIVFEKRAEKLLSQFHALLSEDIELL